MSGVIMLRKSLFVSILGAILPCAILVSGLIAAPSLHAQSPSVTSTVDNTDITLNDTLTLTVTITDQMNVRPPEFHNDIDGIRMISNRTNVTRELRNGVFSARFEFIYEFQPVRVGKIHIGPITVRAGSDTYTTTPPEVNVTQGTLIFPTPTVAPQNPADVFSLLSSMYEQGNFSEAEVDDTRPYLGQQITYTFRFYSPDSLYRPTYRPPDFAGFWNAGQRPETPSTAVVDGRDYDVKQIDTALFPNLAGKMTIEPGMMLGSTSIFGAGRTQFASDSIEIEVRPMPMNEPDGFNGAVGRYAISADVSADFVEMGEPLILTVKVSGSGNVKTLPEPIWPEVQGMRAYDGDTKVETRLIDGVWTGVKTFERVLVPDIAGSIELPPIEYAYFDPELEQYAIVRSDPVRLEVVQDASGRTGQPSLDDGDESSLVLEIRHIKPPTGRIGTSSESLTSNTLYWIGWFVPVLAMLAAAIWIGAARKRSAMVEASRSETARALALTRLADLGSGASAADTAHAALRGYLDVVLGQQTATLTASDLSTIIEERGADPATAQQVEEILTTLDWMRFASPGTEEGVSAIHDVADVVQRLSRELPQ